MHPVKLNREKFRKKKGKQIIIKKLSTVIFLFKKIIQRVLHNF